MKTLVTILLIIMSSYLIQAQPDRDINTQKIECQEECFRKYPNNPDKLEECLNECGCPANCRECHEHYNNELMDETVYKECLDNCCTEMYK